MAAIVSAFAAHCDFHARHLRGSGYAAPQHAEEAALPLRGGRAGGASDYRGSQPAAERHARFLDYHQHRLCGFHTGGDFSGGQRPQFQFDVHDR